MNDFLSKKWKDLKEFYFLVKKMLQSKINKVLDGKNIKIPNLQNLQAPSSSRRSVLSQLSEDNGILFLDNSQRVRNPVN